MINQEKTTIMTKKEQFYLNNFGEEWFNLLKDFLLSKDMDAIAYTLKLQREKSDVIPSVESGLIFKVFKDLQPKDIKVIILGQDPYPQEDIYDGYAFSNSNSLDISPSLRNIIKEINSNYPDNFNLDRMDWSYLVKQGLFPINTALSIRQGIPESHLSLWKLFSRYWINQLATNYKNIVWLLWGTKAHNYEYLLDDKHQKVIKTSHPSPLGALKVGTNFSAFIGSECFIETNEFLNAINKTQINW